MVMSKLVRAKTGRCLPVVLAALMFAGCTPHSPDQNSALLQAGATADSGYYLRQMQQSTNDSKTTWQLLALRASLNEGKTRQAAELYAQLPASMTEIQRQESALLGAEVKLAQKQLKASQALLAQIDPQRLNTRQQARYWQVRIDTMGKQPSRELLRALIAQEPLVSGEEKQKNIDATWQALTSLTAQQMTSLTIDADENTLQGWLDLTRMWTENRSDANVLKAGIEDWRQRYPRNPGAKMLPTQLTGAQHYRPAATEKIALLLPLSGQAAAFSKLIEQGFNEARLYGTPSSARVVESQPAPQDEAQSAATAPSQASQANSVNAENTDVASPASAPVSDLIHDDIGAATEPQSAATPPVRTATQPEPTPQVSASAANPSAEIKVYDTASQPLPQVLAQIQQDGAGLVVGPLLKNNVEQLTDAPDGLNILALNQPERVQNRANICYFSLSPEDEARDAARHIWQQGQRQPLLLLPQSDLGNRVSTAFADEWMHLGGGTVLAQRFGSVSALKVSINGNSGIALSGTPVSAPSTAIATADGQTIPAPTIDATSGGVDAAYIVATRDELALIKPMITMRAGSQARVQLYASSRSAQGGGADFRLEMEGLQFSDIPLLAGSNPALQQLALQAAHNNFTLARLYAMGVDAWTLANHFSQLRQVPGYQISGNTGMLTADANCVITRKLMWLKFQQGQIVPVN